MARGDIFGFNLNIDNNPDLPIVAIGICDSSIIQKWFIDNIGNETYWARGGTFSEMAEKVDVVLPYPWEAVKYPFKLNSNWVSDPIKEKLLKDKLLKHFPGIYTINNYNDINNKQLYHNGNIVPPETVRVKVEESEYVSDIYWGSSISGSLSPYLPTITTYGVTGDMEEPIVSYGLRYDIMIFPDDTLIDGVLNIVSDRLYWITIQCEYYIDGSGNYPNDSYITGVLFNEQNINTVSKNFWNGKEPPAVRVDPDPYEQGGTSTGGSGSGAGGGGDFNNTSTPVNIPSLPSVSAVSTGFISLFNPSISQLQELANYMWSELFDLDTLRKLFADPMDAILGLSIVPVSVPNGGTSLVTVGNISTGVSMTKAASQYVTVDCGVINVNEYWGAYLDYDPFTKAEIYLPYIGTHPIAVDDIMGKSVHVVYHVDILSGACCAYIQCGESVLYSFIGQCSCSIPVTGNDWTNVINGALNIAGSIGTMVATGGATAPMAVGAIASTAVNSFKPSVEKSGSISGMGGMLGIQVPYLILTRPRQALPYNQNKFIGYPSFVTATLSGLSGYTEVDSIHLEGIPATDDEISEIESLLKSGVIF